MEPTNRRVALVTGGAVRVGHAISMALGAAGYDVIVHHRRSREAAEQTAAALRALGGRAAFAQADLSVAGEPERLASEAIAAFGGLDLLVNNAASFERVAADDLDRARWEAMLATNLTGPFFLSRAVHPALRARRGAIVNVVDLCGVSQVWRGTAHYAASKAALATLTRQLALEWAPEVRVNAVAPGTVLLPEGAPADERARLEARIPLGRSGIPEDVARAIVFLAGEPFISGQVLAVDGGRSVAP
jgi:pteridine reductase